MKRQWLGLVGSCVFVVVGAVSIGGQTAQRPSTAATPTMKSSVYFPARGVWETRKPSEVGMDDTLVAVPIRSAPSVEPGEPRVLFHVDPAAQWADFDVAPDGRFLAIVEEGSQNAIQPATVVVNWLPNLKR